MADLTAETMTMLGWDVRCDYCHRPSDLLADADSPHGERLICPDCADELDLTWVSGGGGDA